MSRITYFKRCYLYIETVEYNKITTWKLVGKRMVGNHIDYKYIEIGQRSVGIDL